MPLNVPAPLDNAFRNRYVRNGVITIFFLAISLVFFNKIFTSDYGIHLSIGRQFVETGKVPHAEFLTYPLLGQPINFEELGFQAILYVVYRLVGSDGVSVFVWLMATLAFLLIYKSLRAREIHPLLCLFTLLLAAMPFRMRLQPRPEIIAYFFCALLMYGCSLFYYRGNRKAIYAFPFVFLLWANIHPSTLAGLATLGAFGIQGLVISAKEKFRRETVKEYLLIPGGIFLLCVAATFLSKHGWTSLMTPVTLMTNPSQRTAISEMTSVKNSGFYEYYRFIFALTAGSALLGLFAWRKMKIHDLVLAGYGLQLPLMVARGMAFMSIFTAPVIAQSFDAVIRKAWEVWRRRQEEAERARQKEQKTAAGRKKKQGRREEPLPGERAVASAPPDPEAVRRRIPLPVAGLWLLFLAATGCGAYYLRMGTADLVENGIGLTEHKFSLKSAEFLRNLDIRGNMFNFFDLGGFIDWQVAPQKLAFIDGRAGSPETFGEHQMATGAQNDLEKFWRKYDITYIVTKATDSSGMILPLINHLSTSSQWELVFADGLAMIYVKNVPENRRIIEKHRINKSITPNQIANELIHSTRLGVNKFYAYAMAGDLYMRVNDHPNARKYLGMALAIQYDPRIAALMGQLGGSGGSAR